MFARLFMGMCICIPPHAKKEFEKNITHRPGMELKMLRYQNKIPHRDSIQIGEIAGFSACTLWAECTRILTCDKVEQCFHNKCNHSGG